MSQLKGLHVAWTLLIILNELLLPDLELTQILKDGTSISI